MRTSECVRCKDFPCMDVNTDAHIIPDIDVVPEDIRLILISEAPPQDAADYYYTARTPQTGSLFEETTVLAFREAGTDITSLQDILDMGIYLTTAVKCGKTGYTLKVATIKTCSVLLEAELAPFTRVTGYLLMGDVAIRAVNAIAKRRGEARVVPAGATYKIRGGDYRFHGIPAFHSYLQAGPSFFIEKSKRKMIAEDIGAALRLLN